MYRFSYHGMKSTSLTEGSTITDSALQPYRIDPYGCHSTVLTSKRQARNPFRRRHAYEITNPQLSKLLEFCPKSGWYDSILPWTQKV